MRYLGVSDGNMDEGSLKCDANISINKPGMGLGTKAEIKNMNSPRFIRLALNYEKERQAGVLDSGGTLVQETRLWNENRDITETMRRKEASDDYRYFPEPDMPPFVPNQDFFSRIENALIELPLARRQRLIEEYGLTPEMADFIHDQKSTADFFEESVKCGAPARTAAVWLSSDIRKILNKSGEELSQSPLTPQRLAELLTLISEGTISGKIAKKVLDKVFSDNKNPREIVKEQGWSQITDPEELGKIVQEVLKQHPNVVDSIKNGDIRQKGFLMGQIMKSCGGRAAPEITQKILDREMDK